MIKTKIDNQPVKKSYIGDMNFRASFCDPFSPDIIEIGYIPVNEIMEKFETIPWSDYLAKMKTAKQSEIYYSPSLEIENKDNSNGLIVTAVEGDEWYIFYKRPKLRKRFFGLIEKMDNDYLTDISGQTENDARKALEALINNDLSYLEDKIK